MVKNLRIGWEDINAYKLNPKYYKYGQLQITRPKYPIKDGDKITKIRLIPEQFPD